MATTELTDRKRPGRVHAGLRRALAACADIIVPACCLVCRTPVGEHHVLCAPCWRLGSG